MSSAIISVKFSPKVVYLGARLRQTVGVLSDAQQETPTEHLMSCFRMLFGEKLQAEIGKYGHAWPEPPLKYTELKDLLYEQKHGEQDADAFFVLLETELLRIDR